VACDLGSRVGVVCDPGVFDGVVGVADVIALCEPLEKATVVKDELVQFKLVS
jgi:hypothetical protein